MNITKNEPYKEMDSGHYKLQLYGREQREHTLKLLFLVSTEESMSYGFETT